MKKYNFKYLLTQYTCTNQTEIFDYNVVINNLLSMFSFTYLNMLVKATLSLGMKWLGPMFAFTTVMASRDCDDSPDNFSDVLSNL